MRDLSVDINKKVFRGAKILRVKKWIDTEINSLLIEKKKAKESDFPFGPINSLSVYIEPYFQVKQLLNKIFEIDQIDETEFSKKYFRGTKIIRLLEDIETIENSLNLSFELSDPSDQIRDDFRMLRKSYHHIIGMVKSEFFPESLVVYSPEEIKQLMNSFEE